MSPVPVPTCSACNVRRSFCSLPDHVRSVFETLKTSAVYKRGEVAFHEGDACHGVVVVCEGSLKLVTASSEGRVLLLRFAGAGDILGIAEAMRGAPYECSAIATEPSVLAVVPRATFLRFIGSSGEACVHLTVALSEQYRTAQRETRFLAFGETSTARLARLLLDWSAERGEVSKAGVRIPSHVTHNELAQSIGSTRETVTRILSDLRHRGIVERTDDEILIHGTNELARLGAY